MPHRFTPLIRRRAAAKALACFAVAGLVTAMIPWTRPLQAQNVPLAAQTLAGVWRGQEVSPLGPMSVEVIFFPNGTYNRAHTWGSLMTTDNGAYQIVQNWIHFTLNDYQPKVYKGQTMTRPMSDTWVVGRFDGRFMQATVGGNSTVTVQRVQ